MNLDPRFPQLKDIVSVIDEAIAELQTARTAVHGDLKLAKRRYACAALGRAAFNCDLAVSRIANILSLPDPPRDDLGAN